VLHNEKLEVEARQEHLSELERYEGMGLVSGEENPRSQ
jgi:hypothetical protein